MWVSLESMLGKLIPIYGTLQYYKVTMVPTLLYGSKSWPLQKANANEYTTAEIRFLKMVEECSHVNMRCNEEIRNELKVSPLFGKVDEYTERNMFFAWNGLYTKHRILSYSTR